MPITCKNIYRHPTYQSDIIYDIRTKHFQTYPIWGEQNSELKI